MKENMTSVRAYSDLLNPKEEHPCRRNRMDIHTDIRVDVCVEWTLWPSWGRTSPPTGNALFNVLPARNSFSKGVELKAKPFEKIF